MAMDDFRTLGRSGLVVSPMALGAMTFGPQRWGTDDEGSKAVFDAFIDAGGNFVDTAEAYAGGASETLLGRFIAERQLRDQVVLATKFGWAGPCGPIDLARLRTGHGPENMGVVKHMAMNLLNKTAKTDSLKTAACGSHVPKRSLNVIAVGAPL